MVADAFGLALVLGLVLFVTLVSTAVVIALLSLRYHARGAALGFVIAFVGVVGLHVTVGELPLTLMSASAGMVVGVAIGRFQWPDAESPRIVMHPLYGIVLLLIGLIAIGAGIGVWVVLIGTAGMELLLGTLSEHPKEGILLVVLSGTAILVGILGIRSEVARL